MLDESLFSWNIRSGIQTFQIHLHLQLLRDAFVIVGGDYSYSEI